MALIKCPECGNNVSDKAKNCPHCGNPINSQWETINTHHEGCFLQTLNTGCIIVACIIISIIISLVIVALVSI